MLVWPYLKALWKHWWALMGCAAFTLLAVVLANINDPKDPNKGNAWLVSVTIVLALCFFLIASYRAWKEEHAKYEGEVQRNTRPDIKGYVSDFSVNANPRGPTTHSFKLWLCNERPMQTSIKGVKMILHDALRDQTETQYGTLYPIGGGTIILLQGIGVSAEAEVTMNTSGLFSELIEVYVIDSFEGEHKLTLPENLPFGTSEEAL